MTTVHDFTVTTSDNQEKLLSDYKDKVLLIVNTASKCGFATQFEGLEQLYKKYKEKGLEILGFPCSQFKDQEFDDIEKTLEFCQMNYGVTFPIFAKIDVNGENEHPLYTFLKNEETGLLDSKIKWNFTKFLVDQEGMVVKRYAPITEPATIEKDILKMMKER